MSIQIRENIRVAASPDAVWDFLKTPARVVTCLPGAELVETIDERTHRGRVKVKVGPITTSYAGVAHLEQLDDATRRMQLKGEGAEAGGAGSARLTMTGSVTPVDGASEVHIDAVIDIAGRVMQYGRGMVESVSRQVFKQFAASLRAQLEEQSAAPAPTALATAPATPPPGVAAVAEPIPAGASASSPVTSAPSTLPAATTPAASTAATATTETAPPTPPAPARSAAGTPSSAPTTPAPPRELHLLPLLFSAFVDWLRRLFRRSPTPK